MTGLDLIQANLLSPVVLAFLLGAAAVWVRSDLKIPEGMYTALSIYLLLAIGLKGGAALAKTPLDEIWLPAAAALALGVRRSRSGPTRRRGASAGWGCRTRRRWRRTTARCRW
jgi:hypothetical protein